jgi:hypothetical protein
VYRVVKLVEDGSEVFVVLHAASGKEVFRADNYAEAYRFVLAK